MSGTGIPPGGGPMGVHPMGPPAPGGGMGAPSAPPGGVPMGPPSAMDPAAMMGLPPTMPGPLTYQGAPDMMTPPIMDDGGTGKLINRDPPEPDEGRRKLVERWRQRVREARTHWKPSFDRMRANMNFVNGDQWETEPRRARRHRRNSADRDERYVANIALRHVLQRTAELYPNNPTVKARMRPKILAKTWDGTEQALQQAMAMSQQAVMMGMPPPPEAQSVMMDAASVKQYDNLMERVGKTLELFYDYNIDEQVHSFKSMMKMTTRRAFVTAVGYVKLGFQRAMKMSP